MNNTFDFRLQHVSQDIWLKITQIEALKGKWEGSTKLSPQILGRLKQSVLVTSTGSSTRIEGSKLSDEDIEKMLQGISIQKFSNRDGQEVQGYYELLQNVFNSWESLIFNENLMKHFHKELLKYAEKDAVHRGEYKKKENAVQMINEAGESVGILFETTKAYLTPKEMYELVDWTKTALEQKKYHPLLVIAHFLVEFLNGLFDCGIVAFHRQVNIFQRNVFKTDFLDHFNRLFHFKFAQAVGAKSQFEWNTFFKCCRFFCGR